MTILKRKLLPTLFFALLCFVLIGVIWPLVSIPLRLSRNGKIAQQLVNSLEARFPGIGFRGTASYESEVIYISVVTRLDEPDREDVERWLREQKIEQKIAPQIWLVFNPDHPEEGTVMINGMR